MTSVCHLTKALAVVLLLSLSVITSAQGIEFYEGTWDNLLAEAKAQNKPVFVDCYAGWCVPCKMLEKEVFPDKAVGEFYNQQFINYRIDMEKGEGPDLASRYGVRAYPTLMFVDASGTLLHQVVGRLDAPDFISTGKTALDPANRLDQLNKQFEQGERGVEFLTRYANALEDAGKNEQASKAMEAMLDMKDQKQLLEEENWELIKQYVTNASGKTFQYVWNNREAFQKKYGDGEVKDYLSRTAITASREAGKQNDTGLLNKTLIPVIEATSSKESRQKNVLTAQKQYYKAAKDWDKYADAAVQYINGNHHKQIQKSKELEESLKQKNMTFEEYANSAVANALNGEAWTFYEHIDNPAMLKTALGWAEQSVQLKKQYYNLDTQAALLFKLGETDKAKKVAGEAIAQAEKEGIDASSTKEMVQQYVSGGE